MTEATPPMQTAEKEHGDEFYEGIAHTLHVLELGAEVVEKMGLQGSAAAYRNAYSALWEGFEQSGEYDRIAAEYLIISGHLPL